MYLILLSCFRLLTDLPPFPAPGLSTCLVCVCIGTSVYCDDAGLEHIPALPLETMYLYARFNSIGQIRARDFAGLSMSSPPWGTPWGREDVGQRELDLTAQVSLGRLSP